MVRFTTLVALMVFAMFAQDVWAGPPPAKEGETIELVGIAGFGNIIDDQKKPIRYILAYKRANKPSYDSAQFELGCEWTQKGEKGDVKWTGAEMFKLWADPKKDTKAWIRRETKTGKVLEVFNPEVTKGWEK